MIIHCPITVICFYVALSFVSRLFSASNQSLCLWDFEDGTMQGFEVESGDCGVQPLKYVGSGDDRWTLAHGGTYYVNTFRYGSSVHSTSGEDSKKCVFADKTHFFNVTSQTEISWYETGNGHSLCLKRLSDDAELLCQRNDYRSFDMQSRSFAAGELSALDGERVYVTFSDEQTGGWDHIQLDNLAVANAQFGKSHNLSFNTYNY